MSEFQQRSEQPYVSIPARATLREWGTVNALVPEVYGWLAARDIAPAGALFYRHKIVGGMDEPFEVEVGVPVAAPVEGDGRVLAGAKPAGRYAVRMHRGHPDRIVETHQALLAWAEEQGFPAARDGEAWVGVYESYLTDPEDEPDPVKWETEVAYLVSQPR
ncbi:GyrI-like domain-containing protein [Actinophytocola gossypii]|uniref:GyrI-like domain-containing protein n=1 Tax=Actinophytocola gossypii TaxID=2812003 RepID=A0ABT2J8L7_9PSEU|nr:GyrI-like domain-containing protein [Actinophytocola gossypii]MCT2584205.1 GyrI-like domain-containing protein [Actinophytocola gossypii]